MSNLEKYENKRLFVEKFVKPMIIAMNIDAVDVEYKAEVNTEKGWVNETVTVYYGNQRFEKVAYVNYDSELAIVQDMFKQGVLG